eukprot:756732-Hanusia_phi.AAC.11
MKFYAGVNFCTEIIDATFSWSTNSSLEQAYIGSSILKLNSGSRLFLICDETQHRRLDECHFLYNLGAELLVVDGDLDLVACKSCGLQGSQNADLRVAEDDTIHLGQVKRPQHLESSSQELIVVPSCREAKP